MSSKSSKSRFSSIEKIIIAALILLLALLSVPALKKVQSQTRKHHVIENLQKIVLAGQQYNLENATQSVSFDQLNGHYFPEIEPYYGEDYTDIVIYDEGGEIQILVQGNELAFEY